MSLNHSHLEFNRAPNVQQNRAQRERRAGFYSAKLHALRHQIALNSRLIADPRHAERRELLVMRLAEMQARAADVFARLVEVAS